MDYSVQKIIVKCSVDVFKVIETEMKWEKMSYDEEKSSEAQGAISSHLDFKVQT